MTIHEAEANARATITSAAPSNGPRSDGPRSDGSRSDGSRGGPPGPAGAAAAATVDGVTTKARFHAHDAGESAENATRQAIIAKENRIRAQDAAIDAREQNEHARAHAATARAAAEQCQTSAEDLSETSRSLAGSVQSLNAIIEAQARAHAQHSGHVVQPHHGHDHAEEHHHHTGAEPHGRPGVGSGPPGPRSGATGPGAPDQPYAAAARPADEIVVAMSQLNTLLLGSSPAFAQAMRLQTDAIASGLGVLNAISNQQSHYALEIASTARGIVETHGAPPSRPCGEPTSK